MAHKNVRKAARTKKKTGDMVLIRYILVNAFKGLKIANRRGYEQRRALLALSEVIIRLSNGQFVEPQLIIYILEQMNDSEDCIARIRAEVL